MLDEKGKWGQEVKGSAIREGLRAVLAEHGHHSVHHDAGLGEVRSRALDQHVLRACKERQRNGSVHHVLSRTFAEVDGII